MSPLTIFIVIFLCLSLVPSVMVIRKFAPWVPIRKKDMERVANLLNLRPGQKFCDLGCGDGRLVIYMAKKFPKVKCYGVEFVPLLWLICVIKAFFYHQKNARFYLANLYNHDISKYDAIYVFGTPKTLKGKLIDKFTKEGKKELKIVSYIFKIEGLKLVKKTSKAQNRYPIYLYTTS